MQLESKIQADIIDYLKGRTRKSLTYKHPPYPTGIPDVIHYEKGRVYLFEVKRTKNDKARAMQKVRKKQLKRAIIVVHIVRSVGEVKKIMKKGYTLS
jgi:hypothetical protein